MRSDRIDDPLVFGLSTGAVRRLHLKRNDRVLREDSNSGNDFRQRLSQSCIPSSGAGRESAPASTGRIGSTVNAIAETCRELISSLWSAMPSSSESANRRFNGWAWPSFQHFSMRLFFSYQDTLKIRRLTSTQQQKLTAIRFAVHDLDSVCGMETHSSSIFRMTRNHRVRRLP